MHLGGEGSKVGVAVRLPQDERNLNKAFGYPSDRSMVLETRALKPNSRDVVRIFRYGPSRAQVN